MAFTSWLSNSNVGRNVVRTQELAKENMILGAPYKFNELADPNDRVYLGMLVPPPIVSLIPCRQVFNKIGTMEDESIQQLEKADEANLSDDSLNEIVIEIQNADGEDSRYFQLEPDPISFGSHVRPMLSRVLSRLEGNVNIGAVNNIKLTGWGGLSYWCSDISVSESGSNEFGESFLATVAKEISNFRKQAGHLMSYVSMSEEQAQAVTAKAVEAQNKLANSIVAGDGDGDGIINSAAMLGNKTMDVLSSNVNFAQVWKDSGFARSYSLEFKFQAPSADSSTIFAEILTPYLALLAMSTPRQSGPNTYEDPFYIKADCPGYFHIDCGAITGLSVSKGQDNDSWNSNGMITGLTVTLELVDLYPALLVSGSHKALAANFGMATYLDNIAGMDYTRIGKDDPLINSIASSINNMLQTVTDTPDQLKAEATKKIDKINPFK